MSGREGVRSEVAGTLSCFAFVCLQSVSPQRNLRHRPPVRERGQKGLQKMEMHQAGSVLFCVMSGCGGGVWPSVRCGVCVRGEPVGVGTVASSQVRYQAKAKLAKRAGGCWKNACREQVADANRSEKR